MRKTFTRFAALIMSVGILSAGASAASANAFTDVPDDSWYAAAVDYAVEHGMFSGTSPTTFSPAGSMTRSMFVAVLARIDGADTAQAADAGFTDVPESWYTEAVNWAAEQGYVGGVGDNRFAPDLPVTREQIAVILRNYLTGTGTALAPVDEPAVFKDMGLVSPWATESVEYIRTLGLMAGNSSGNFNPQGKLSRAEAAVVFMRLHQRLAEQPEDDPIPGTDAESFALKTTSFNFSSSVYDDNNGDMILGYIELVDEAAGINGRYDEVYGVLGYPYTFTSSDPGIIVRAAYMEP